MAYMWECMKVTFIGDLGWGLLFVGVWLLWKMFFASVKQIR